MFPCFSLASRRLGNGPDVVRARHDRLTSWNDAEATLEYLVRSQAVPEPYEPGQFYKRELPHLLRAIARAPGVIHIDAVIIDGHVWLGPDKPGLGAHLYQALRERVAVIGPYQIPTLLKRADQLARRRARVGGSRD